MPAPAGDRASGNHRVPAPPRSSRRPLNTEARLSPRPRTPIARTGEDPGDVGPVEPIGVAFEARGVGRPHRPPRVRHLVFERAAVALPRVAPCSVMNSASSRPRRLRRAGHAGVDGEAAAAMCQRYATAPPVRASRSIACPMRTAVGLVVEPARDGGDGPARHQLANEHDGPAQRAVRDAPHVEAQVDLVEAAMAGIGTPARRVSSKRKPTRLTRLPRQGSSVVPAGTSGASSAAGQA